MFYTFLNNKSQYGELLPEITFPLYSFLCACMRAEGCQMLHSLVCLDPKGNNPDRQGHRRHLQKETDGYTHIKLYMEGKFNSYYQLTV
jgi:hypothetical protein